MFLRLKLLATFFLSKKKKLLSFDTHKKKIVIALAANYGNLGDVAITFAQKEFLKTNFPEYEVIEFEISRTFGEMRSLKKYIQKDDIITIVGGGNLGDLYDDIEFARQFFIRCFPKNQIIIFPQTITFSKSILGRLRLLEAKSIYNKHKDLTIFVRERFSYEEYKKIFKKIELVPDIVLSLDCLETENRNRSGVIVCFRNDKENGVSKSVKDVLIAKIQKKYTVLIRDTHIGIHSDLKRLYIELQELIKTFQKSRVIVTDRLHGMILSYITHTPCVVFCGGNKKIQGCYEWISASNYVKLIENDICKDDINAILREIDKFYYMKEEEKRGVYLKNNFNRIKEAIKNF